MLQCWCYTHPEVNLNANVIIYFPFQYVVEDFSDTVFLELLNYVMTGTCAIKSTNVVGLACAAEHYEIEELRPACHTQLPKCLSVSTVCEILGQLEKHLAFSAAKTMIVQCLEFVDSHATELLSSDQILHLSENMVHLVLRRDTDVTEILKVKAAFAWAEVNAKPQGKEVGYFGVGRPNSKKPYSFFFSLCGTSQ